MKLQQQQQAQELHFQTDLSLSEIAASIGVSRRTLHYWVQQNNWDRLRKSARRIPSFLAENCYQVLGNLTEHLLSEERVGQPVTYQEANTIHKLTLTINKLKTRATLNENMETFALFTEHLFLTAPALAEQMQPHINSFIENQAVPAHTQCRPSKINDAGFIPTPDKATTAKEAQLDLDDFKAFAEEKHKTATSSAPQPTPAPKPAPTNPSMQTSPNLSAENDKGAVSNTTAPAPLGASAMRGEATAHGKLPRIMRRAA